MNSPKSTLNKFLNFEIPNYKRPCNKILKEDFFIPKYSEYYCVLKNNYTIKQLKLICKHYKLPCTGNKLKLATTIFNYLKMSNYIILIQALFRGYLIRKINLLRGPAFIKRKLCNNATDFFTMEKISSIPFNDFFSIKDSNKFIYGFSIVSLYHLFHREQGGSTQQILANNPYNREKFPLDTFQRIKQIIKLNKICGTPVNISINDNSENDSAKQLDLRILALFQNMDALGNYTQHQWFTSLNRRQLTRVIKELYDIWHYRAQLSSDIKREICPPHGNPFRSLDLNPNLLHHFSLSQLKRNAISIFEKMVNSGSNDANRNLGAFYVLSALTLVNPVAAEALPWLYQSVVHHNN